MAPSEMVQPVVSEFQAGDMALVRRVDPDGFQGRDPHPPRDLAGQAVVIIDVHVIVDADSGNEFFVSADPEVVFGDGIWMTEVPNPLWIYDAICVSGPHRGSRYEMLDAEMVRAIGSRNHGRS